MNYRFASRAQAAKTAAPAQPEGAIVLSSGFGFPDTLPHIGKAAQVAAEKYRAESMQYTSPLGINDMRDEIVSYVGRDGVVCSRENVIVVNGAKHGLDLVARVFLEPNDQVIIASPTYLTAIGILKTHQVRFLTITQDEEGLRADELEKRLVELQRAGKDMPKLLFDVPDFHNPTGITMSAKRRKTLVELAQRFGFMIVEDDPYRRIRFEGEPVAPIKSFDKTGVVIALGTGSKILAPGLRIGWVIADAEIVRQLAAQKADGGSCAFTQRIFIELLRDGEIDQHANLITATLKKHCAAMIDAFAEFLPDVKIRRPSGGYYLWAELPEGMNSDVLAGRAAAHGALVYSGTRCFAVEPKTNFLRLSFSYVTPEVGREGVRRLAKAYEELAKGVDPRVAEDARARAYHSPSY